MPPEETPCVAPARIRHDLTPPRETSCIATAGQTWLDTSAEDAVASVSPEPPSRSEAWTALQNEESVVSRTCCPIFHYCQVCFHFSRSICWYHLSLQIKHAAALCKFCRQEAQESGCEWNHINEGVEVAFPCTNQLIKVQVWQLLCAKYATVNLLDSGYW